MKGDWFIMHPTCVHPQRSWRTRLLTTLAQQATERAQHVFARLLFAMGFVALALWCTVRPLGDPVPPLYGIGFRTGWIMARLLMPLLTILGGLGMLVGGGAPLRQSAGRHWAIAGAVLLFASGAGALGRHGLHPLATGHWSLTGSQLVVLVLGAFMALAMQTALLTMLRAIAALLGTAPVWWARRWLRTHRMPVSDQ